MNAIALPLTIADVTHEGVDLTLQSLRAYWSDHQHFAVAWSGGKDSTALGMAGQPAARVHRMSPGATRAKERSRFFPGIAAAMAAQWGQLLTAQEAQAA